MSVKLVNKQAASDTVAQIIKRFPLSNKGSRGMIQKHTLRKVVLQTGQSRQLPQTTGGPKGPRLTVWHLL